MNHNGPGLRADLLLALRLARRELRSGMRGFGIFLACLALGVGAMSTVGLMTASFQAGLRADAAVILGGDLSLSRSHVEIEPEVLGYLNEQGTTAHSIRMRAMVRDDDGAALSEIKAVDGAYPLYGEVGLASGRTLAQAWAAAEAESPPGGPIPAILETGLLVRLGAQVGDELTLGGARLKVADELVKEPDRAASLYGIGPTTLVPVGRMAETGLLVPGAVVTHAYAFRAAPGVDAGRVQAGLEANWPDANWRIRGLNSAGGRLGSFLDHLGLDLSLVALATLLLGGIGVAGGVSGHLARRDATIATMKCLGASRRVVMATYLLQVLFLAGLGSVLGLAAGTAGAYALCRVLATAFEMPVRFGLHPGPVLTALGSGLLTGLAFSLWPLSAAARTTAARLFTGYAAPGARRPTRRTVGAIALTGLALFGLTWATAPDHRVVLGFAGALAVATLVFTLLGTGLKRLARALPRPKDPRLSLALANIHRPGSTTTTTVFSLGFGLTVLCCVALVNGNLRDNVDSTVPETMPSYFFINVRNAEWAEFQELLGRFPGLERMESTPVIRGRISELNGRKADADLVPEEVRWALRGDRFLTFAATIPGNSSISAGEWWPEDYSGPPLVSLEQGLAEGFGLRVGETMGFNVLGRPITATISNLRKVDWTTLQLNQAVVFSPGVLEGAPYTWLASVHAAPEDEPGIFKAVTERFPDVVAMYMKDILADVSRVLGDVSAAAGAAAGLTLVVGLLILGEAARSTLRARRYDLVVFKVFGATRRDVLFSLACEFALQGVFTALVAAGLGSLGSWLFVTKLLNLGWRVLPGTLAGVALGGVAVVLALGLAGVRGALSQKAWPLLRND
jgi:putative ABC transport system permease protein